MRSTRLLAPVLVMGAVATSAAPSVAAGGGYGPATLTGPPDAPGGYTHIVTAQTVATAGGTVSAGVPGAVVDVHVPANAVGHAVIVEVTAPSLSGVDSDLSRLGLGRYTALSGVGVKVLNLDGTAYTASFVHSVAVVMRGSGVSAGDTAIEFTSSTHAVEVPVGISGHTATVRIMHDPDIALLKRKVLRNPYSEPSTTLRLGNRGTGVKWVQWAVSVHIDGIFGRHTLAAVMAFQERHHLTVDGVVGPKTRVVLARVTR